MRVPIRFFHSDQAGNTAADGTSISYESLSIIQSMSRKGNCLDNACAECFSDFKIRKVFTIVQI